MENSKNFITYHLYSLWHLYRLLITKADKKPFAIIFNITALLLRSSARVTWLAGDNVFAVSDKTLPDFRYVTRHQQRCCMYIRGVKARANRLADTYFLSQIDFNDGDSVIDCGANIGDFKIWFDLNNMNINYTGFEPAPTEFKALSKNIASGTVHNIGLWHEPGELKFYVKSQEADSSLIEPKSYDDVITTKVMTLDSFIDGPVKCLKLEAEGAEPEILAGLGDKLSNVAYIAADLGYERGINAESTLVPVTNFLLSRGFELVDISHYRVCALFRNKNIT